MSLLFRIAVYVPVLFLIAVVICGQQHATANATLAAAARRTLRWLWWSALLVGGMLVLEFLFIGF